MKSNALTEHLHRGFDSMSNKLWDTVNRGVSGRTMLDCVYCIEGSPLTKVKHSVNGRTSEIGISIRTESNSLRGGGW